ncbi:MAG TPA: phosphodiesterase, partial [Gammaproteobacteria bacterium]|nr:phosphodiesterase [Gammaproteobacteria bacterium]
FKVKVFLGFVVFMLAVVALLNVATSQLTERLAKESLEGKAFAIVKFLKPVALVGMEKTDLHWFGRSAKLVLLSEDVSTINLRDAQGELLVNEMATGTVASGFKLQQELLRGKQSLGLLTVQLSNKAVSQTTEAATAWVARFCWGVGAILFSAAAFVVFFVLKNHRSQQIEVETLIDAPQKLFDEQGLDEDVIEPALVPINFNAEVEQSVVEQIPLFSEIVQQSPEAVVLVDLSGEVCDFNFAAEKLFGFKKSDVLNKNVSDFLLCAEDIARYKKCFKAWREDDSPESREVFDSRLCRTDKAFIDAKVWLSKVSMPQGLFVAMYVRDISFQKATEKRLDYLAFNDELTDLPNLSLLSDHLRKAIFEADAKKRQIVVIKIGIDRFKHVNESLGHRWGDYLLRNIAARLKASIRRGDIVSRINGDQFVVVLVDIDFDSDLDLLVQKYVDCFSQAFQVESNELHVNVSVGATVYPGDEKSVEGLLRDAESAMFRAKNKGGSHYQFFSNDMREMSHERLYLEGELRKALDKKQFELHYQPQVNLETGKIIGVEALIRWNHPDMGVVSPVKFIPLAEDTGLIIPIGEWVLRKACEDNKALMQSTGRSLILAVNLSARQFMGNDLVQTVATILNEVSYPPELLELEITESLLMENMNEVADTLQVLSDQGIRISMDDFGTGYSSLNYLKSFPINTLKVDRSFIHNLDSDEDNASIVTATIQMAHSLNIDIVAEGVETAGQLTFLANIQCDKIQGYYFSHPLASSALKDLLDENRKIQLREGSVRLISGIQ